MLAAVGIVGFGWAAALAAGVPGHFSVDSVNQLAQGRMGRFDDWHPPLMAWLLGLADRVTPGGALFVIADVTIFFACLLGFSLSAGAPRVWGLVALALVVASPQAMVFQGVVWKDILFADAALGAFAALAQAGHSDGTPSPGWLGAAFLACVVAALVRQTGLVVPLAAAGVYVAIDLDRGGRALIGSIARAGAGLLALLVITVLAHAAFAARGDGQRGVEAQLAMLRVFDLAGALRLEPELPLTALHARAPALERFERAEAAPAWRASTMDGLDALPGASALLPPRTPALADDWRSLVLRHPWLYGRVRAQVFWDTLATPDFRWLPPRLRRRPGHGPGRTRPRAASAAAHPEGPVGRGLCLVVLGHAGPLTPARGASWRWPCSPWTCGTWRVEIAGQARWRRSACWRPPWPTPRPISRRPSHATIATCTSSTSRPWPPWRAGQALSL